MSAPPKNDCVYCAHEQGSLCAHFDDPINPMVGAYRPPGWKGLAARRQDECAGFTLDPRMAARWQETFGDVSPGPPPRPPPTSATIDEGWPLLDVALAPAIHDVAATEIDASFSEEERFAVRHVPLLLAQNGRASDAEHMATRLDFHDARLRMLGETGLRETGTFFTKLAEAGIVGEAIADWRRFLESNAHLFTRGSHDSIMLFQAALSEPGTSAVGRSAQKHLEAGARGSGALLRRLNPQPFVPRGGRARTFEGHGDGISCIAIHPNGAWLVSASFDGSLRVWDIDSGSCLKTLSAERQQHFALELSRDGAMAITTSGIDLELWSLSSGECVQKIQDPHVPGPRVIAFSQRVVAFGGQRSFAVRDVESRARLGAFTHAGRVCALAIHSDEDTLAATSHDVATVYSVRTGQRQGHLSYDGPGKIRWVRFHADACLAVIVVRGPESVPGEGETKVMIQRISDGAMIATLQGHRGDLRSFDIHPTVEGPRAVSADECGTVKIWDPDSFRCLGTLEMSGQSVAAAALCRDGRRVAVAHADSAMRLWDLGADGAAQLAHPGGTRAIQLHPGGRVALSGGADEVLRTWDVASGTCLRAEPGLHPSAVHWGRGLVASGREDDSTIVLLDLNDSSRVLTLHGHTAGARGYGVSALPCDFDREGGRLLSLGSDRTLRVWDTTTGACLRTLVYTLDYDERAVTAIFHPDGRRVLLGKYSGSMEVWDMEAGARLRTHEMPSETVDQLAILPLRAQILSSGRRGGLNITDLRTGVSRTAVGSAGATYNAWTMTQEPSGRVLVCTADGKRVKVWDLMRRREIACFESDAPVLSCSVAASGVVAFGDATGRLLFLMLDEP